jgi:hypothetical protein
VLAIACKYLRQLRLVEAHARCHKGIGILHLRFGNIDAEPLGFGHFQNLIDQAVERLLARRRLLGAQLNELATMLDVKRRDRLAIDEGNDLLRGGGRSSKEHDGGRKHGGSERRRRQAVEALQSHVCLLGADNGFALSCIGRYFSAFDPAPPPGAIQTGP